MSTKEKNFIFFIDLCSVTRPPELVRSRPAEHFTNVRSNLAELVRSRPTELVRSRPTEHFTNVRFCVTEHRWMKKIKFFFLVDICSALLDCFCVPSIYWVLKIDGF